MDPLITVEELAGYLQRDLDRYSAELAVAGASGIVRDYLRWDVTRQADAEFTLDGSGSALLSLPTLKLNAVTSVAVDGEALADTDYRWSASGVLSRSFINGYAAWPLGFRNITATVDHGYDATPDSIRLVACSIAARAYTNPETLRSRNVGGTGRTFIVDVGGVTLTQLEMAHIAGYRLP